ncbi:MAG: M20/M25/M40 family metallo-hydrolase, partial [Proteobacteria bacterium]|nr:M20/M25/M40 family metallo-hydrolase [Pseudomonadota bacterium]
MDATTKAAIQNAMTRRRAAQFKLLTELVGIDTSNPPGDLAEQAERIGKLLEALGFEVERLKVPKEIAARRNRAAVTNLVARRRFSESGPTVALVTAVDTVPVEDDWTHDPFAGEIKNGVIHGRGVLSGKADLTAQAFAVVALAESAANLTGSVELHVSFDGSGPLGCKWMLDEKLVRPDFVIGAGPARAIAAHSMGTLQIDVEIRGLAAPSHAPERGFDALEGANKVVALLHQYRAGLRDKRSKILGITHPSLVVEEFYAGSEAGGVPAGARFRIDRRLLPEEEAEKVETQLTRMIGSSVAKSPGLRCRIKRAALIPAMRPSDATRPLINLIAGHV